jgi:hypothetical protein
MGKEKWEKERKMGKDQEKIEKKIKKEEEKAEKEFKKQIEEIKNSEEINEVYKIPTEYIKSVARGFNKAFIFLGSCGLGKSYLTRQILSKEGTDFIENRGVNSPLGLYQFLYDNNKKGKVLVFDDVAGLVNNPNAFSILLGVLWEGIASWNSTSDKLKIPKRFVFEGNIIVIANKLSGDNSDIVKSRCLTYDLTMNCEQKIKVMNEIARQKHDKLGENVRKEIVEFIKKNVNESVKFDLRTQRKIEQLYLFDKSKWKELARPLLVKQKEIDFLIYCLNNNNNTTMAEWEFCRETGLSRQTFYNYKRSLESEN